MRIVNSLILVAFVTFVFGPLDAAEKKCPSPESLAQQFLSLEVAGIRTNTPKPSCFSKIKADFSYSMRGRSELYSGPKILIESFKDVKIVKVEKEKEPAALGTRFVASFEVRRGKEVVSDWFSFVKYEKGPIFNEYGCAGLSAPPENLIVSKECD